MSKVKKGDSLKEKRIGGGSVITTCIGFVVYTEHENPTNKVGISLNKEGNYAFKDDTHILSTKDLAKNFAEKHQIKYKTILKFRPYYSEKYI